MSARTRKSALAPTIALGDATATLVARTGLTLETSLNPFLLPPARSQATTFNNVAYFSSYTDSSTLNLMTVAGDLNIINDVARTGACVRP